MNSESRESFIRLCLDCCITENRPKMQSFVMNNLDSFDSVDLEILIATVKEMKQKSQMDLLFLHELYKRTNKFDVDKVGLSGGFRLSYLNLIIREQLNISVFTELQQILRQ